MRTLLARRCSHNDANLGIYVRVGVSRMPASILFNKASFADRRVAESSCVSVNDTRLKRCDLGDDGGVVSTLIIVAFNCAASASESSVLSRRMTFCGKKGFNSASLQALSIFEAVMLIGLAIR